VDLVLGQDAPPQAEPHGVEVLPVGRDEVRGGWCGDAELLHELQRQRVEAVELEHGHGAEVLVELLTRGGSNGGGADGEVAHVPEGLCRASRPGLGVSGDRGQDRAGPQEVAGSVLVLDAQVEEQLALRGDGLHDGLEPRREGVGVHRQRQPDRGLRRVQLLSESYAGLLLQQEGLPGQAQQLTAHVGCADGLPPYDHRVADLLLQARDPLAHGASGDVQPGSRAPEGALVADGHERLQRLDPHPHIATLNHL
jgi:hypothetical protein